MLMSLPPELLHQIISYLTPDTAENKHSLMLDDGVKQACGNARLSCKLFYNQPAIGRFLFETVNVFLTKPSVRRVTEISRDTSVSRLVTTIRLWKPLIGIESFSETSYRQEVALHEAADLPIEEKAAFYKNKDFRDAEPSFSKADIQAGFEIYQQLCNDQRNIMSDFTNIFVDVFNWLPNLKRVHSPCQTIPIGSSDKQTGSGYLAKRYPKLLLDWLGEQDDIQSYPDEHSHLIIKLLENFSTGPHQLCLGAVSQLFTYSSGGDEVLGADGRLLSRRQPLELVDHLEFEPNCDLDLDGVLQDEDDFEEFPPWDDDDEGDISHDCSTALRGILAFFPNLKILKLTLDHANLFGQDGFTWSTKLFKWQNWHWPQLHTFVLGHAMIEADDMCRFLQMHAATLEVVGLNLIQMRYEPRESWRQLVSTMHVSLNLKDVTLHSRLWDYDGDTCPPISCPPMGPECDGSETEEHPDLRDYILHRKPWTEDLAHWMDHAVHDKRGYRSIGHRPIFEELLADGEEGQLSPGGSTVSDMWDEDPSFFIDQRDYADFDSDDDFHILEGRP